MMSELTDDLDAYARQQATLNVELQRVMGRLTAHSVKLLKHVNDANAHQA